MPSEPRLILTAEQAALFDALKREEALARRYRKHQQRAEQLRDQLNAIFGTHAAAVVMAKNRRGILRKVDKRHFDPLPAKTVDVVSYTEFPVWDL